jgi:predicted kinase
MPNTVIFSSPTVVVFTGLPGTGKSTLADSLATTTRSPSFSLDWILGAMVPTGLLSGLERSKSLLLERQLLRMLFTRQLMLGQSAILDCIVPDDVLDDWTDAAGSQGGRLLTIECLCSDEAVHRSRVKSRVRGIPGWHEVDWSHVEFMRAETPPLVAEKLTVDAVRPLIDNLTAVHEYVGVRSQANL